MRGLKKAYSLIEIADWFHVYVDTLERRLKEEKGQSFAEFFTLHRVQGKIALRRNMFKMSEKHPSMAIFLSFFSPNLLTNYTYTNIISTWTK